MKVKIKSLDSVTSNDTTATKLINDNFTALQESIENTLSRDGTVPNYMDAELDMNSRRIINTADPIDDLDVVNKKYVDEQLEDAKKYAAEAKLNADRAENSAEGAKLSMETATAAASQALLSEEAAKLYSEDAGIKANQAAESADKAAESADKAAESADKAQEIVDNFNPTPAEIVKFIYFTTYTYEEGLDTVTVTGFFDSEDDYETDRPWQFVLPNKETLLALNASCSENTKLQFVARFINSNNIGLTVYLPTYINLYLPSADAYVDRLKYLDSIPRFITASSTENRLSASVMQLSTRGLYSVLNEVVQTNTDEVYTKAEVDEKLANVGSSISITYWEDV